MKIEKRRIFTDATKVVSFTCALASAYGSDKTAVNKLFEAVIFSLSLRELLKKSAFVQRKVRMYLKHPRRNTRMTRVIRRYRTTR